MTLKPTVGRIVHLVNAGQHHAAIVVHVWSDTCVNLSVFDSNGSQYSRSSVPSFGDDREGSWHWPERD